MADSPVESSRVQFCIDSPVESSFVLDRFDSSVESRFVNMVQYIVKSSEVQWNPVESTGVHVDCMGGGKVLAQHQDSIQVMTTPSILMVIICCVNWLYTPYTAGKNYCKFILCQFLSTALHGLTSKYYMLFVTY